MKALIKENLVNTVKEFESGGKNKLCEETLRDYFRKNEKLLNLFFLSKCRKKHKNKEIVFVKTDISKLFPELESIGGIIQNLTGIIGEVEFVKEYSNDICSVSDGIMAYFKYFDYNITGIKVRVYSHQSLYEVIYTIIIANV